MIENFWLCFNFASGERKKSLTINYGRRRVSDNALLSNFAEKYKFCHNHCTAPPPFEMGILQREEIMRLFVFSLVRFNQP